MTPDGKAKCQECGGTDLSWFTQQTTTSGVQNGRLRLDDVTCLFVFGCNTCSATVTTVNADRIAVFMNETNE
ncbi:hypothetical protein [Pseudomonas urethralis]|uniref:hypothetical protein n=1 Tax=Pseudomonas urethralis TaxID=2740517 RepID=UPI0015970FE2|nr:hypothetical protein [Pseudomonas urethralis]